MRNRSQRVIGYIRVSTEEQSQSGLGLADQRAVIDTEARRRGWDDVRVVADEGFSAKNLDRPAIAEALQMLSTGQAAVLVVAKLDRLSRSLYDFAGLMERANKEGWAIVALDLGVDMTTPSGQLMANVMASFSQYERQLIGARTSAALQQLKAQGKRLGRPVTLDREVSRRINEERALGRTLQAIADDLNREGVPTARGGRCWYPATVAAVLRSASFDRVVA
jgi:DNA invertase Pin-like site-specific DNA recombinase